MFSRAINHAITKVQFSWVTDNFAKPHHGFDRVVADVACDNERFYVTNVSTASRAAASSSEENRSLPVRALHSPVVAS
jgi:hypothetical protein